MSNINQCARCALAHQCESGQIRPQIVRGDCEGDECLAWEPMAAVREIIVRDEKREVVK